MLALTLVVALSAPATPSAWSSGRVRLYTSSAYRVDARAAAFASPDEIAFGASVRVAARWF